MRPAPLLALLSLALAWPALPVRAEAPEAARAFEQRLLADPSDFEALLGAADALNREMAKRTNGNLPLFDGLQDTAEHRAIWAELAPRALDRARRALALRPDSAAAAAALATAYMFYASSLGIVSAILKGSAGEYREHARRLIALDPTWEAGLGDYLMASFYLVAPWPVGDADESLRHFERALASAPESVRNHYGLGVYWARGGDAERARHHFDRVESLPCTTRAEQLLCDFMKREGFLLVDSPIFTPSACEGTTTLFETQYFDERAYLTQSGQLYAEAAAMAHGRVYCFGPAFRAEKSKTRRHLIEFWMMEPEWAFATLEDVMQLMERLLVYTVDRALTDSDGRATLHVPGSFLAEPGPHPYRFIASGDLSSARGVVWVIERGQTVVVFDIDGTLTTGDSELIDDAFGGDIDVRPGAVDTARHWADAGHTIV